MFQMVLWKKVLNEGKASVVEFQIFYSKTVGWPVNL